MGLSMNEPELDTQALYRSLKMQAALNRQPVKFTRQQLAGLIESCLEGDDPISPSTPQDDDGFRVLVLDSSSRKGGTVKPSNLNLPRLLAGLAELYFTKGWAMALPALHILNAMHIKLTEPEAAILLAWHSAVGAHSVPEDQLLELLDGVRQEYGLDKKSLHKHLSGLEKKGIIQIVAAEYSLHEKVWLK